MWKFDLWFCTCNLLFQFILTFASLFITERKCHYSWWCAMTWFHNDMREHNLFSILYLQLVHSSMDVNDDIWKLKQYLYIGLLLILELNSPNEFHSLTESLLILSECFSFHFWSISDFPQKKWFSSWHIPFTWFETMVLLGFNKH